MKRFEFMEHTADVGIIAYGTRLSEAFANCAYAMFTLIANLDTVSEVTCQLVRVDAEDQESLLVAWLNELLYILDVNRIIIRRFDITKLDDTHLEASCYGETIDPIRHDLRPGVKAATYHMLQVECSDICRVQVILDI